MASTLIIATFILYMLISLSLKALFSIEHHFLINTLFIFISTGILIGSLHNSLYTWRDLYYRFFSKVAYRHHEKLTLLKLKLTNQRSIAVFVPAWKESAVIDKMVENILDKADYGNYTVFVGTYPNDPDTQASVDRVASQYPNIIKVVTKTPGPTSKSDCLNNIYEVMQQYEKSHNKYFDMVILHDAEDVVHPYEFLLANYFLLVADAMQIPILPLPTSPFKIIHWIYADEFAMFQMRDSFVREKSGGFVPFAGVGMCLSRRALIKYQDYYKTTPFPENSLTEDYLLASRMNSMNLRVIFLNVTLADEYIENNTPLIKSKRKYFISNWAYFPMSFKRSVRQKARWLTGIVFQGWQDLGWKGSIRLKENLIKDRRLIFDQVINLGAFGMLAYFLLLWLSHKGYIPWHITNVTSTNIYQSILFSLTLLMLFKDMVEKFLIVSSVYGPLQGLLSIPRGLVANLINGLAALQALVTFYRLKKGSSVKWDKTDHLEGVGETPVATNSVTEVTDGIILNKHDIDSLLDLSYEDQLAIIQSWDLKTLNCQEIPTHLFENIAEATTFQKMLLSLFLKNVPENKLQEVFYTLLNESNITIITNTLEYLYTTHQFEKYYTYARLNYLKVEQAFCMLERNRVLLNPN